ncbi:MAG: type II secretion system protein GspD [Gammaproteobacteria bacterium]
MNSIFYMSVNFKRQVTLGLVIYALTIAVSIAENEVSLTLSNVEISEAMEMLSIKERVNIVLSKDVAGDISINLFNVSLHDAILAIANAGGYAVEFRNGSYFVINRDESGKYANSGLTELRTFKVRYSDTSDVEQILETYLSEYGKITTLVERRMLVIEDLPSFLTRIERLLAEIDQQPKQIFIEAKILEVTLRDSESYGINWSKLFSADGGDGSFGIRGLSNTLSPGLFFDVVTPNVELALDYLFEKGRLRTLSTPKLLALEDQQAEVIIGDRLGFRVTTTINQVTSETIEFLESGVIMRVTPSVDGKGRILLNIHPEVSTGRVEDGIPSQVTTEVTTQMLVDDGQTVFIGGLIRRTLDQSKAGVPVLGEVPVLGRVFSNSSRSSINTETVVQITPYIVDNHNNALNKVENTRTSNIDEEFTDRALKIDQDFHDADNDHSSVITGEHPPKNSSGANTSNKSTNQSTNQSASKATCNDLNPANLSNQNCQLSLNRGFEP